MTSPQGNEAKALLQKTIRSFLSHRPYLVLDTRPRTVYRARHLSPSTNIPLERLERSSFQLPSKQTPFAVIEPQQYQERDDTLKTRGNEVEGRDSGVNLFNGKHRPSDLLKSRGWKCEWAFEDHPLFWSTMAEELSSRPFLEADTSVSVDPSEMHPSLQILESLSSGTRDLTRYHYLFQPSPVLMKILPVIERDLMALRSAQPHVNEQGSSVPLQCLDVGCGSGRDMTYMVARSANGLAIDGAQWSVLGMDQREDICDRARQLAEDTFLQDGQSSDLGSKGQTMAGEGMAERIKTLVGKVDSGSGVFLVSSSSQAGPSDADSAELPGHRIPLVLKNIQYQDATLDHQHQQLLNREGPSRQDGYFDFIIMIRFLQRSLFAPMVNHWLRPGGFLLLSTFVSDTDLPQYSKPGPGHRLRSRTEAREILEALGMKIIMDEISIVEDGVRPIATVVAQKPHPLQL